MNVRATLLIALAAAMLCATSARAIVNGQIDTFEDGTSDFWMNGMGNLAVSTGGPGGAGDHFLQIVADGNGAGGKLVGFNSNQWTGNFTLAGVNAVEMDLKAFSIIGASTLTIRIAFRSATGAFTSAGASGYVSPVAFTLSADGQWHHAIFNFSSLTPINSSGGIPPLPLATFLTGPAEFRIINAVSATSLIGDNIISVLGIDNIHAIPEPGSLAALGGLALGAVAFGRRRRRS